MFDDVHWTYILRNGCHLYRIQDLIRKFWHVNVLNERHLSKLVVVKAASPENIKTSGDSKEGVLSICWN